LPGHQPGYKEIGLVAAQDFPSLSPRRAAAARNWFPPGIGDAMLRDVFGDQTVSSRLVFGAASLPLGSPVELEVILEVKR
jgi:hypothetical protein